MDKTNPKEAMVNYMLGKVYHRLGQTNLSNVHMSYATELDPKGTAKQKGIKFTSFFENIRIAFEDYFARNYFSLFFEVKLKRVFNVSLENSDSINKSEGTTPPRDGNGDWDTTTETQVSTASRTNTLIETTSMDILGDESASLQNLEELLTEDEI